MEGQPLGRAEDGDGVGQVIQRLVMGLHVAAQGVARLLGLGHLDGEGDHGAASARQRLGQDLPRPAPPARRGPPEAVLTRVQAQRLGHQPVRAAIETQPPFARFGQGLGPRLGQPGAVGPDQPPGPVHDPGRRRRLFRQNPGPRAAVQSALAADPGQTRQPQPGRPAMRPALDRPCAFRRLHQGLEGLSALNQRLHAPGMQTGQHRDHGLRRRQPFKAGRQRRQGLGRAERRLRLALRAQGHAHVVERGQGPLAGRRRGLGPAQPALDLDLAGAQPRAQPPGPGADRQRQTGRPCGGCISDVGLGHGSPDDASLRRPLSVSPPTDSHLP